MTRKNVGIPEQLHGKKKFDFADRNFNPMGNQLF